MILDDVSPQSPTLSTQSTLSTPSPLHDGWPTLETLSRRYIDRALQRTKGNKTRAAELLGIDRRTLNRILARDRSKLDGGSAR